MQWVDAGGMWPSKQRDVEEAIVVPDEPFRADGRQAFDDKLVAGEQLGQIQPEKRSGARLRRLLQ